ncbi:hypothetical protein [Corynebacterium halotolerans]|uniref:hypothetical protein n=1 Tax=Corynebacterium halotolerans TaxID=225326 RepID=UPI003CF57364
MYQKIDELRKAFWHLRHGGLKQVRRWNRNRIAGSLESRKHRYLPSEALTSSSPSLTQSWQAIANRLETSLSAADVRQYRNFFAQGWILTNTPNPDVSLPEHWKSLGFGAWTCQFDPDLEVHHVVHAEGEYEILLLGQATDSAKRLHTSKSVASELLKELSSSLGWDAFDEAVTWLGGRFVAIGRRSSSVRIHVDAMASRSCYWARQGGHLVFASHSILAAQAIGDVAASGSRWVLTHPDYHNPAGKCLPGMVSPHDAVKMVIANCALTIQGSEISHRRFFSTPPESLSVAEAAERYLSELRFQMDAALAHRPKTVFGLTAGADSRAILTATLDLLHTADVSAMTYHFFARNADHSREDLLGANRLANLSNLKHRVLDVSPRRKTHAFTSMYSKTFPTWARFPTLARTYYEELGADEALILGIGGEVGTVFYRDREFDKITPEVLAGKYTQSAFQHDPRLIETMTEYMDYTELSEENSAGYDLLDLFYWEHRMSTWAAYGYSEADFGPLVVLPLNSRRIFHAMLSLPFKDRLRRSVYHQLALWSGISA